VNRRKALYVVVPASVLLALGAASTLGDSGPFSGDEKTNESTSSSVVVVTTSPEPPTTVQAALPTPATAHTVKNGWSVIPRHDLTPGATDRRVTQANIDDTICTADWVEDNRLPPSYTTPTKTKQIAAYGYSTYAIENFDLDHLVPLELGGDPSAIENLWPQPWEEREERLVPVGWGVETKNALERKLHNAVCAGEMPLADAQKAVAGDWIDAANERGIAAGEKAG
jgi:hypothetical protein